MAREASDEGLSAEALVARLGLAPHPEGGWYRETWRAAASRDGRSPGTAILYLLAAGGRSHWHTVDADELWLWHAGAPLALLTAPDADGPVEPAHARRIVAAGACPDGPLAGGGSK